MMFNDRHLPESALLGESGGVGGVRITSIHLFQGITEITI
jgi:hypothetical protein